MGDEGGGCIVEELVGGIVDPQDGVPCVAEGGGSVHEVLEAALGGCIGDEGCVG